MLNYILGFTILILAFIIRLNDNRNKNIDVVAIISILVLSIISVLIE